MNSRKSLSDTIHAAVIDTIDRTVRDFVHRESLHMERFTYDIFLEVEYDIDNEITDMLRRIDET